MTRVSGRRSISVSQSMAGVARYRWNCSEPDERGVRYIPGVREYESDVLTATTDGNTINIYRVQNLNTECYGEVTAIEFCYQYTTMGSGKAIFNWTVLILEETSDFTITRIYAIESRPDSMSGRGDCENIDGGMAKCCDRQYISNFNFESNKFVFGVTESAQGNTHRATLLGFFDNEQSLPEYIVDTVHIPKKQQTISVGSSLSKMVVIGRGLRMLWFIIGKLYACDA